MTYKNFTSFSPDQPVMIHALIADKTGVFIKIRFPAEAVSYVQDIDETRSGLVLKSGEKISVNMPGDALEKKIFTRSLRDGGLIDLTGLTGIDAGLPALATDFDAAATGRKIVDVPLTISLFVRRSQTQNFKMFTFTENMVKWADIEGKNDGVNGHYTALPLYTGHYGPFNENTVMFDMPRAKFMELYNLAKMNGDATLDLRDLTRRIDPDGVKRPKSK